MSPKRRPLRQIPYIAMTTACLLCCVPQQGICLTEVPLVTRLLDEIAAGNQQAVSEQFETYVHFLQRTEDPVGEFLQFVEGFLEATKTRYGYVLTLPEVCSLARKNLPQLPVSQECREAMVETLLVIEEEVQAKESTVKANSFAPLSPAMKVIPLHLDDQFGKVKDKIAKKVQKRWNRHFGEEGESRSSDPREEEPLQVAEGGTEALCIWAAALALVAVAICAVVSNVVVPGSGSIVLKVTAAIAGL